MISIAAIAVIILGVGATGIFQPHSTSEPHTLSNEGADGFGSGITVTLHKDPNCGCCEGYAAVLRREGFDVTVKSTDDLMAVKEQHSIPPSGASCHTATIDDYVVEGHVPLEALAKLLDEKPDIAGIGLARMPAGTPGMPGIKRAPYEVYQLSDTGETSPYLTI